jgi:hypothetical protein
VTKDEAQDWLRKHTEDPFVVEQVVKAIELSDRDLDWDHTVRSAMLALADLIDEVDN